ncbi:MAG TPA: 23S rRNA (uracil(747)-C(5))-methyltransferase RlmC [Nocardioides sp.]|nr:23S rRNA (uracil(747)-C(5))-methyltransferase RlmC [Nocardioides sp.]
MTVLDCRHFAVGECRSCAWLGQPYAEQLAAKDRAVRSVVAAGEWLPPQASVLAGFRNKAKLVVTGTADAPVLGILGPDRDGVDLRDCGLYPASLQAVFPLLAAFIGRAGLAPYSVRERTGELKHLLVTESPDGELMVRFVLRSTEAEARIRKHLPGLLAELSRLRVVTLNLQPAPAAVLEGEREIVLTEADTLPMRVGDLTLHLRPRSFFQTNTAIAAALYRRAAGWVDEVAPASVWDLYCGVGGFALHAAAPGRDVVGIEISADAIASAERSRDEAGLPGRVRFEEGDATAYAAGRPAPDLVIVNPPRRGLGQLAADLEASAPRHVLYSSCNPETLARDLGVMGGYRVVRGQLFDMFPQTGHAEVLVLLARGEGR